MTNATPTGSVCPLRRPPKGKDHPSASRTAFFGLPPDSRNPSSPQPSRLLDSPHHHADVGLADEKSGLGHVWRVSYGSFFQVNRFLIEKLVETALDGAEGQTALDLYAGVGLFSLALAQRFASVTAVESGARAAGDLRFNAERAGLELRVEQTDAEAWLEQLETAPDFVLLDPPRAAAIATSATSSPSSTRRRAP